MTLISRLDARAMLRTAGLSPKKSFGQNFLVAPDVVRRIAEVAVPDGESDATVIEIGAGTGALTAELAVRARRVIAIERDRDLVPLLRDLPSNVEVVEADAKTFDYAAIDRFILAGNLPYQLTGPLIERATTLRGHVTRVVVMVQREVADRMVASPSTKTYGALTVFVRAAFDVRRELNVSPGSFFPPPDVTSTVITLTPRAIHYEETETFRALVRAAFAQRRKTLRNAWRELAPADVLASAALAAHISLDARGETLDVAQFDAMSSALDASHTAAP